MENSLILKYRPDDFDSIIGHGQIVSSVKSAIAKRRSHAFLFCGPAGIGKTSLARIIAKHLGCEKRSIREVNAADQTGVDDVRALIDSVQFSALGESPVRVVIVDEIQRWTGNAFDALLKPLEEPPAHVYWIFCTTNPAKIPKAILTRCLAFTLKPVGTNEIYQLLLQVRDAEGMKTSDQVLNLIAGKSDGSPRQALSNLAKCARCQDRKEAAELINTVGDEAGDVIEICRGLTKNTLRWPEAMAICQKIKDENPESLRIIVTSYLSKVILGTSDADRAGYLLSVVSCFDQPYPQGAQFGSFLISLGRALLQGD